MILNKIQRVVKDIIEEYTGTSLKTQTNTKGYSYLESCNLEYRDIRLRGVAKRILYLPWSNCWSIYRARQPEGYVNNIYDLTFQELIRKIEAFNDSEQNP